MADVITRLRVESSEYDSKIDRARQGLLRMEEACRKVGGTLAILEKDELEFVRGLGQMETVSKSARGKVAELTKAFTDLSAQYKRLTDEEKQGDFGKALQQSLAQLKTRIQDGQKELKGIEQELKGTAAESKGSASALDTLAGKFGMSATQLVGWGAALAAAKKSLDVMKDAFFASEASLDAWNSLVYSSQSAYNAFLTSLNTGDFSEYLSRINEVIHSANEAYAALDRLSTQKAINNPAIKAQEAENERFRAMLRTGRYIAPNDGRTATMKEGQLLTDQQKKVLAQQLENGQKKVNEYIRSEIKTTTDAIEAVYRQQAAELGMTLEEFKRGTANMAAFDERMEGYRRYIEFENAHTVSTTNKSSFGTTTTTTRDKTPNPYEQYKAWGVFKDDGETFGKINELINQRAALQSQNYGNTANAYRAINRAEGSTGRSSKSASQKFDASTGNVPVLAQQRPTAPSTEAFDQELKQMFNPANLDGFISDVSKKLKDAPFGTDIYDNISSQLADATALKNLMETITKNGLDGLDSEMSQMWGELLKGADVSDESVQGIVEKINEKLKEMKLDPINIDVKTGSLEKIKDNKEIAKNFSEAAGAVQALGSALNGIEDPTAKVMGTVAMAIATIASTFAQSLKTSFSVWDWIAGAAAGAATMTSTIAAIKSATEYHADGGVVGQGGMFTPRGTDTVPAMLTPGEIVLTAANQQNLANQLSGTTLTATGGEFKMRLVGTQLIGVINNTLKDQGKHTIG